MARSSKPRLGENPKEVFFYIARSNMAAPFDPDVEHGIVSGSNPRNALLLVKNNYYYPFGTYSIHLLASSARVIANGKGFMVAEDSNEIVARWLSAKARTIEAAGPGEYLWVGGKLYVNGEPAKKQYKRPLIEIFRDSTPISVIDQSIPVNVSQLH